MFSILRAKHSRDNEAAEGFGVFFDDDEFGKLHLMSMDGTQPAIPAGGVNVTNIAVKRGLTAYKFSGISQGQSQRVLFKPLLGILN